MVNGEQDRNQGEISRSLREISQIQARWIFYGRLVWVWPTSRQEFISRGKTGGSARPGFSRFVKMGAITQNVGIGMHDGIAIIHPQK
jgi:hypothetical protein